jgi:hypothetical protein
MRTNDIFAYDRSLNGNHTPACALPTRGGVCDCWPPTNDSWSWGQTRQAARPAEDSVPVTPAT